MQRTVNIIDGSGEIDLINGTYNVSVETVGYDTSSITPNSITVGEGEENINFTISASGVLTLHVTEDGSDIGTPVVGATFVRTDAEGNPYGQVITTDSEGNAVFNNVPYAQINAPLVYFKQTASSSGHEFESEVQSVSLLTNDVTVQITNMPVETITITLTDANYDNLPIEKATITFTSNL